MDRASVRRVLFVILAIALFSIHPTAQIPLPKHLPIGAQPPLGNVYRYDVKGLGIPATDRFRRAVAGRLNDDPRKDVAVLRGSSPILFVDPSAWDAALRVPITANDIAVLPHQNGRKELLVVNSEGLRAVRRRSDIDSWDVRVIGRDVLWGHSTIVRVADFDGVNGADIVGVRPGVGYAFLIFANPGSDGDSFSNAVLVATSHFAVDATDVALAGAGMRWLAVSAQDGLYLHGPQGQLIQHTGVLGGHLAVLHEGGGAERLACVARDASNHDVLTIVDLSGIVTSIQIGNLDVTGIASADFDRDGDDDLLLAHRASHNLKFLWNDAGVFSASSSADVSLDEPGPATDSDAMPVLADLDDDSDTDIFFPVQSSEQIFALRNGSIDERARMPGLQTPVLFNRVTIDGAPFGYLQLTLTDAAEIPAGATHVEVLLWRKPDLATPTSAAILEGHALRFPLSDGPEYATGVLVLPDPTPGIWFWMQQYVELNEDLERVAMHPAATYAFTVEFLEDSPILEWLTQDNTASIHSTTLPDPQYQQLPPGSIPFESVSTIVGVSPLISFDDDDEPDDDFDF